MVKLFKQRFRVCALGPEIVPSVLAEVAKLTFFAYQSNGYTIRISIMRVRSGFFEGLWALWN